MALPQDETTTEQPSIDYEALGLEPVEEEDVFGGGVDTEIAEAAKPVSGEIDYEGLGLEPIEEEGVFGAMQEEPIPVTGEEGFLRQAADVPLKIGESINSSIKGITDLFGADNAISQNLSQNADWYRSLLSAQALEDEQEVGRILQEAENEGILDQLGAGLEAFSVAPVDFVASGIGSLATFAATGVAGRAAALAGAARAGLTGAKAAQFVQRGVQATQLATGAAMGAGIVKGEIYQSVKDEMLAQGKTEEDAKRIATEAQSYMGKNLDQILLGAGLGTIDAFTGAEKIIGKVLTKGGLKPDASRIGNIIKNGLTEAAPEFVQAAQEKFASNLALQREGVNVPLTQGVFSQGALEGLVGLGLGVGAGAIEPRIQTPPTKEEVSAAAAETQDVARQNKDIVPATASLVEGEAEQIIQSQAETPDERVSRLQREAKEAAGITLEEEPPVSGLPPVSELPPVKEGFVRLYHGGASATAGEFTPYLDTALGYAQQSKGSVFYVDVPENSEFLRREQYDEQGNITDRGILISRQSQVPNEIAQTAQRAASGFEAEPVTPAITPAPEAAPTPEIAQAAQARITEREGQAITPVETPAGNRVEAAAYQAPDGTVYYGASHLDAMAKALDAGKIERAEIDAKQETTARETPEFGFATNADPFVTRDQAETIARQSGQITVEQPATGKLHSNEVSLDAFAQPAAPKVEQPITATRTVADAIRDKDTFIYNNQRGAVTVEDGVTVFRPFGTQEKFEVSINPNQTIGEIEGIQWARKGQARVGPIEAKPETATIIESQPTITTDEVDQSEPDFEVPVSLIEIEKSKTLNDLADLFDTGESRIVQEGKRARKVSQTPEFYRQATPQQIDLAKRLIDNALRIIDALSISDQQKQDMAEPFLLLDQDINNYENNPEYQRYKSSIRAEVRPAGEVSAFPTTETEVAAWIKESEQRAAAEAGRLGEGSQLEPLRRVARAEQTEEDVAGLVDSGFVEVYKGQPVITQAGLEALPEAERPRLTPEARKIQIDTRTSEAAAEAISKNLRIGVDQVPVDVRMPAGWTLVGDIYVPPTKMQRIEAFDIGTVADVEETADVFASVWGNRPRVDTDKILSDARTKRAKKPFTTKSRPLTPKEFLNKPVRFAMKQAALFNFDENTRKGDRMYSDIAAILAESPIDALDNEDIVTLSSRNRRGRERRFWGGDIGMASTKGMSIKTFIHEVGHSLTADQLRKYAPKTKVARPINGKEYIDQLKKSSQDENVPEPVRRIFTLYISTIEQLGLMDLYGRKGGLAGTPNPDVSMNNALELQSKGQIDQKFTRDDFYALANVYEFVSQTFTGGSFRNKLKELKSPVNSKRTLWQDFVSAIRQILGLPTGSMAAAVIEASIDISMEIPASRAAARRDMNIVADKMLQAFNSIRDLFPSGVNKKVDEFAEIIDEGINPWVWRRGVDDWNSYWPTVRMTLDSVLRSAAKQTGMPNYQQKIVEARKLINDAKQIKLNQYSKADIGDLAPPEVDIWKAPEQEITSQETSINERKIPAVFNQVKEWTEGTVNADIGGGRFDNVTNWLRERGVTNLIIDWFNRDRAFNEANIDRVRGGQADTATISNVLNVIQEPDARDLVIRQAADAIKEGGTAYFYIYEGNGSGDGRATSKGWQENRKASTYIDEVSRHFGSVERRNQMIIAKDPIKEAEPMAMEEAPEVPTFTEGTPEAATLKEMQASMAKVDAASEAKGGKPETQKISDIAANWMDQGGDERALQDAIAENTNLTPANAARVAKAIARQYDIQQSIATAFLETQTGLSVEALPEGVTLPKEVDPDRPKPVMQRLFDVFMGVRVPPVKIEVNEKTALKQQIRLKAAANRAAKAEQKRTAEEVVEIIKAMELLGPVRPKQVQALAKRAARVIWTSEKSVEAFSEYAAKVVENANYDADLRAAKDAQKRAKQLSKQKKVAMSPQRQILEDAGKVPVNKLDDPRMFAEAVNYYLRGFKDVLSPDYVVIPDAEMESYLSGAQSETQRNQRDLDREANKRLAEKYGIDPDLVNEMMESFDILRQIEAQENREALENLLTEKAIETQQGLKGYDTGNLQADQRPIVAAMLKIDPKALDPEERQRFIRITNNIIYNNQTNGAEYFMAVAKGQQSAREAAQDSEMIAKNRAWINLLPRFISERMQRGWALELQSVADTFRNAFGKGAMAKVYDAIGMLDLNLGFTKANNVIDEIQEKIAEFHRNLEKKYKAAARNQDGLLAEGVVGFLIQSVPKKDEVTSINQRRDLILQDIANRRRATGEPDKVAMADRIEAILNRIDGESVEAILNNMKREFPANHESLVWYKDTLLPQYKDFLKSFDENFNDQANNYDNPNYLTIGFTSAGPSLAITPEEQSLFYDQVSLRPKQSAYTIKRVDYTTLPTDRTTGKPKEIEFNLRRNVFNSLSDQINKAYTSSGWQRIASFMKTPEAEVVFGGAANKDFFIERLNRLRLSRMRRGSMGSGGAIERAVDSLSVISRKLGTGIALGGIYQWIKQPPDQLITALGSGGRYDLLAKNIAPSTQKAARELLNKFSIGRRGDASSGYKYINQMEGHQNRLERYFSESKWDQAKEQAGKIADVWMVALKSSDFLAASAAWMTYYEGELNKQDIKIDDWSKEAALIESDPKRRQAAAFAEQMTDIYQGSSDPTSMATFAQSGKTGWENLVKAIFVPFNSFAIQQRMRLYSDARDAINGSKGGKGGLAGTIGGLILFHATKRYVIPAISGAGIGILYGLMGVDMDEPDEEKQKEEANKKWRQFLADITGNLLVGGTPQIVESQFIDAMNRASYLVSLQLENDSILNDEGEIMSYDQYSKERSPFYRYKSFDNAMSLGMLDIGLGQAEQVALQTKMLATPEEMEMYTPEEQRLLYFSALSEWLYLMRLNDADFARLVSKARRDMIKTAEEREKELKRIRSGR